MDHVQENTVNQLTLLSGEATKTTVWPSKGLSSTDALAVIVNTTMIDNTSAKIFLIPDSPSLFCIARNMLPPVFCIIQPKLTKSNVIFRLHYM